MGNDFFIRAEVGREEAIAITGKEQIGVIRIIFDDGLVRRLGIRFFFPFYMLDYKIIPNKPVLYKS